MTTVKKQKISLSIIFSLITIGIYGIYWQYSLIKNIKALKNENSGCAKELLCILFIPFYSIYWWYTRGCYVKSKMNEFNFTAYGNGTVYLILSILGLDYVAMAIMQNDFNSSPLIATERKKINVYKLTTSAILVALSTVLSLIKVWQMPLGGAITLLSMVPVCLISILYGTRYSIIPCFLYGAIQMFLDNPFGWGLTPTILIGSIIFDYLFAFGILCLAGVFRKFGTPGVVGGVALACVMRFLSHFISGYVLFAKLDQWAAFGKTFVNHPMLYSVCYNGFYMLPELVFTVIGMIILCKTGAVKYIQKITERKQ